MALEGDPAGWAEQLARIASELRCTTLLDGVPGEDPAGFVHRLGEDVAPRVRELLGSAQQSGAPPQTPNVLLNLGRTGLGKRAVSLPR